MPSTRYTPLFFLAFIFLLTALPAAGQKVVAKVTVGITPASVAVNAVTNKIYVANQCGNDPQCRSSATVTVIDGGSLSSMTVPVGFSSNVNGSRPILAVNSSTNKIYVTNACGNDSLCISTGTVTVIDGTTLSTTTVPVGFFPTSVAINSATNKIYVTSCGDNQYCASNGTVTVIDGSNLSTTTVSVGFSPSSVAVDQTDQ